MKYFILSSWLFLTGLENAWAQETANPDPMKGFLMNLPIFAALFALFYFGLIRPQKNQQKKHKEFVSSLSRGDQVVTSSGIIGNISGLTDKVVTLEVSPGTELKILRSQIQNKLEQVIQDSPQK